MRSLRENVIFDLMCPLCGSLITPMNDALWGLIWTLKCDSCNKEMAVYDVLSANEPVVKKFLTEKYYSFNNTTVYDVDEIYKQLLDGSNREL